jgi:hypothetical protein
MVYLWWCNTNKRKTRPKDKESQINTPINYTEKFEQTLREIDQAVAEKIGDTFELPTSKLFAVDYVRGEVPAIRQVAEDSDIYGMLEDTFNAVLLFDSGYNGFAIVTTGWAAPINKDDDADNEVAPSQHPERKRVRLMTMMHNGKMGSSIRFTGDKTVTYDEGNAMGSLASAMQDMYDIVRALKVSSAKENERQLP